MAKILLDTNKLDGFTNEVHLISILNYTEIKDELELIFDEPSKDWGYINLTPELGTDSATLEIFSKVLVDFVLTLKTSDDSVEITIKLRPKYVLDTHKYNFPEFYIQFLSAPYFKVLIEMLEKGINNLVLHFQDTGVATTEQQVRAPRLIKGDTPTAEWDIQWFYQDDADTVLKIAPLEAQYKDDGGWITIPSEIIDEMGLDAPKAPYRYVVKFDEFAIIPRNKNSINYLSISDMPFVTDIIAESDPEKKFTMIVDFFNYLPVEMDYFFDQIIKLNTGIPFIKQFFDVVLEKIFEDNPEIGGDIKSIFVEKFEEQYNDLFLTESWDFDLTNEPI